MDNANYYETYDWNSFGYTAEQYKVFRSFVPEDVSNILDVGCGNGTITNRLAKEFKTVGVDRSASALEMVECETINASCDNIPVDAQSYEMIFSTELLEHLPIEILSKTIEEFKRISSKYILISVPNKESLIKGMVQCNTCDNLYHVNLHQNRFDLDFFKNEFAEYEIVKSIETGKQIRSYNQKINTIKQGFSKRHIPYYFLTKNRATTFCPVCNVEYPLTLTRNIIGKGFDFLNAIISPKRPCWLIVLMERKNDGRVK